MPPPAFGKGNAFKTATNDKFLELSRRDARRFEGLSASLDSESERTILQVITGSTLASARKNEACKEVRKALALCRRGIDPSTNKALQASCLVCAGSGRVHAFLCLREDGRRREPEKSLVRSIWPALDDYLIECRGNILEQLEQVRCFHPRATSARLHPLECRRHLPTRRPR
jgi:hypothetical protein